MDDSGFSRGYGFVKFGLEEEQKAALYEMNGYVGLGSKALKICSAVPKPRDGSTTAPAQPSATSIVQQAYDQYSQYYDQYSQYYNQWPQGYNYDSSQTTAAAQVDPNTYYAQQSVTSTSVPPPSAPVQTAYAPTHSHSYKYDHDYEPVEHKVPLDVDKINQETINNDRNLYDSLESSKWQPLELLETF